MKKTVLFLTVLVASLSLIYSGWFTPEGKITSDGGYAIVLKNATTNASVKGTIVSIATRATTNIVTNYIGTPTNIITNVATNITNYAGFIEANGTNMNQLGVVFDAGKAIGADTYIVVAGQCDVLLETNVVATNGWWMYVSSNFTGRALPQEDLTNTLGIIGVVKDTTNALTNIDMYCRIVINNHIWMK